jgi:hypothetical protein
LPGAVGFIAPAFVTFHPGLLRLVYRRTFFSSDGFSYFCMDDKKSEKEMTYSLSVMPGGITMDLSTGFIRGSSFLALITEVIYLTRKTFYQQLIVSLLIIGYFAVSSQRLQSQNVFTPIFCRHSQ